ncbi:hypothetical protein [Nocardia sp. NPDC059228]|uniref:hypothetical protein n=1 Tax=Nocardia sp. NPDC059228 TaxID=3346777 RepID=UPI0036A73408
MSALAERRGRSRLQTATRIAVLMMTPAVAVVAGCSSDSGKSTAIATTVKPSASATSTVAVSTTSGAPVASPGAGQPVGGSPVAGSPGGVAPQQQPPGESPDTPPVSDSTPGGVPAPDGYVKCTDKINYVGDPRSNAEINRLGEILGHCPDPVSASIIPTPTTTVAPTTTTDPGTAAPVTTTTTAPQTTTPAPTTTAAAPTTVAAAGATQ